jgi:hypothetical protein
MTRTVVRVVVIAALLTGLLLLIQPPGRDRGEPLLPWQVSPDGRGGSSVFGIVLGETPLGAAEQRLGGNATLTLFESASGGLALEAFLQKRVLRGLKADFVLGVDLPRDVLGGMHLNGLRIAKGRDATRRVTLAPEDAATARAAPVKSITYLPMVDLDAAVIERRFGAPAEVVTDNDGITHWLYPELGLDIAVNDDGKDVLQYVAPRDFERLTTPLRTTANQS